MLRALTSHIPTRSISCGRLIYGGYSKINTNSTTLKCLPKPSKPLAQICRHAHKSSRTVRIILVEDMPNGKGFKKEIHNVRPGYARNFLIPQKIGVYATPEKFSLLGMLDPKKMTLAEKKAKALEEAAFLEDNAKGSQDKREADRLRIYLRNKELKIWRRTEVGGTGRVTKGMVNSMNVREKLGIQLKIDLEPHERVLLRPNVMDFDSIDDLDLMVGEKGEGRSGEITNDVDSEVTVADSTDDNGPPSDTKEVAEINDNTDSNKKDDANLVSFDGDTKEVAEINDDTDSKQKDDENLVSSDSEGKENGVEIRQLGTYLATIHLSGGYVVPLRVNIVKR